MCPVRSVYLCVGSLTTMAATYCRDSEDRFVGLSGSSEKRTRLPSLNSEEFNYRELLRPPPNTTIELRTLPFADPPEPFGLQVWTSEAEVS